jgi:hypothetical protein
LSAGTARKTTLAIFEGHAEECHAWSVTCVGGLLVEFHGARFILGQP